MGSVHPLQIRDRDEHIKTSNWKVDGTVTVPTYWFVRKVSASHLPLTFKVFETTTETKHFYRTSKGFQKSYQYPAAFTVLIWMFPKIVVVCFPPNHPIFYRVFPYKSSILGGFPLFLVQHPYEVQQLFHHNIQTVSQVIVPTSLKACALSFKHTCWHWRIDISLEQSHDAWENNVFSDHLLQLIERDTYPRFKPPPRYIIKCVCLIVLGKTLTNMRVIWSESFKS